MSARAFVVIACMLFVALLLPTIGPGGRALVGHEAGQDEADSFSPSYPAQPEPGRLYWGAAVAGNGDPAERHEKPAGTTMSIRRTFFLWRHIESGWLERVVGEDHAKGRLPWISVKTPPWAEVAEGRHDAMIDRLLRLLHETGKPVWLTVWHEPENDSGPGARGGNMGTPADHLAMNRRFRQRMAALEVDSVALGPILMAWTWNPRTGRDPAQWWDGEVYDFLGIDIYRDREDTVMTDRWFAIRRWAAEREVDIAVGEWGMRGRDRAAGERVRRWYEAAVASDADGRGARVVALCAFDSHLNSPTGSWELRGAQLTVFHELMADQRTARIATPDEE